MRPLCITRMGRADTKGERLKPERQQSWDLDLGPRLERQRVDLDKAGAGLLVKRGVAVVGGQTVVIEAEGLLRPTTWQLP